MQELQAIFNMDNVHIILIDDARCFGGSNDYPTIKKIKDFVLSHHQNFIFTVCNDIIRIHKKI